MHWESPFLLRMGLHDMSARLHGHDMHLHISGHAAPGPVWDSTRQSGKMASSLSFPPSRP
ncbi:hypothetical protein SMG44B_40111 [Stenotrophomonas maltophilia]|nr:hypothetical protein BN1263190045 [Stenotrophomonas maltophilia]